MYLALKHCPTVLAALLLSAWKVPAPACAVCDAMLCVCHACLVCADEYMRVLAPPQQEHNQGGARVRAEGEAVGLTGMVRTP